MTKQPTLTKADLIEEVLRITELPRKESETIVETISDSAAFALGNAEGESAAIRKPARRSKCPRKKFPSSSPARN